MTDLEDRLRHVTDDLPSLPDGLDEVRDRGRRRRLRTTTAGVVVALTGLVLAGTVALERFDGRPVPVVDEPTEPAPSPDVSPTGSPNEGVAPSPGPDAEAPTVAPGELPWDVVTYGSDGVVQWVDGSRSVLTTEETERVAWVGGVGAVAQARRGAPIVLLGAGDGDELVGARRDLLLWTAGEGPDGRPIVLVTWTRPAVELDFEILLGMVDVQTRELAEIGIVGNREDGPDAFAIADGELYVAYCHMQCGIASAPLTPRGERRELVLADWRAGVAVAGDVLATVAFDFDPEAGMPYAARLALHDARTGDLTTEVPLPDPEGWEVDVSLSPDGSAALVVLGSPDDGAIRTYLVDGLPDTPRVRRLSVDGGAQFTGAPSRAAASTHAGLAWPEVGPDAAAEADRPETGEREPWRRDPVAVAEAFLFRTTGWTVQEDSRETGGGDASVTVRSPAGIEHTVYLRRPAGSDLWWIASMAPSEPDLQGLGVSSRDGVVEASGSAPPGSVSARLVITFPGSMTHESTADIGDPVRIATAEQGTAPFRLQLEHLDADGRVGSLHMTWIPAGDFAAG